MSAPEKKTFPRMFHVSFCISILLSSITHAQPLGRESSSGMTDSIVRQKIQRASSASTPPEACFFDTLQLEHELNTLIELWETNCPEKCEKPRCKDELYTIADRWYGLEQERLRIKSHFYSESRKQTENGSRSAIPPRPVPDHTQSRSWYLKATETYPDWQSYSHACFKLGLIYRENGDLDSSEKFFLKVTAGNGEDAQQIAYSHLYLSEIYRTKGIPDRALLNHDLVDTTKISGNDLQMLYHRMNVQSR
jgi:tetratricopeptide (TPR) repeat protein